MMESPELRAPRRSRATTNFWLEFSLCSEAGLGVCQNCDRGFDLAARLSYSNPILLLDESKRAESLLHNMSRINKLCFLSS